MASRILSLLLVAPWIMGCDECRSDDDCPSGEVCINGECRPITGGDADTSTDGELDTDPGDGIDAEDPRVDRDAPVDGPVGDGTGDAAGDVEEEEGPCTTDEECADDNPCTDDSCHESFHVCENVPVDGRDCDDGDPCNGVGVCDDTGACVIGSSPLCDDHNDCTFDTCVSGGSDCTHDPAPLDGTSCDNGLHCDGTDECDDGSCLPTSPDANPCDDGDLCTLDVCSEGTSGPACSHPVVTFRGITCGGRLTGITSGASGASSYGSSCSGSLGSGPEEVVIFAHTSDTSVTISLVDSTASNNELYVLTDGCDPSTCTQVGGSSVTITSLTGGTRIYISVESVSGGARFALQATCS
jgi:hypothetical protein